MSDFTPPNPYIVYAARFKELVARRKQLEADTYALWDEFKPVFNPDDLAFVELVHACKQATLEKKPQAVIDKMYLQLAEIYKRWTPIHDVIIASNPHYATLFAALANIIKDTQNDQTKVSVPDDGTVRKSQKRVSGRRITRSTKPKVRNKSPERV